MVTLNESERLRSEKSTNFFAIVDSGDVVDFGLSGGRVGVFTASQAMGKWTDLSYLCQD